MKQAVAGADLVIEEEMFARVGATDRSLSARTG
jgi:hypothetical protein